MGAATNYGNVTLSGGSQSDHFDDVYDLTAGDMVISFTYDANGMVDDAGAHAWAELGVRSLSTATDFNPYWRYDYPEVTKKLFAGKDEVEIGRVKIWGEGDTLYVKFKITDPDCVMTETHLAIGDSEDDIFMKNGNPVPGQFPYSTEHDPAVTEFTYAISLTQWPYGTELIIAAMLNSYASRAVEHTRPNQPGLPRTTSTAGTGQHGSDTVQHKWLGPAFGLRQTMIGLQTPLTQTHWSITVHHSTVGTALWIWMTN